VKGNLMSRPFCCLLSLLVLSAGPARALGQTASPPGAPLLSTVPTPPAGAQSSPLAMSGIPLHVDDLPVGTITVRVIRGSFEHHVSQQPVVLIVNGEAQSLTAITDEAGRARFDGVAVGGSVRAETLLDGEPLRSSTFDVPTRGGVRLILSAAPPGDAQVPAAPAVARAPLMPRGDDHDGRPLDARQVGLAALFTGIAIGVTLPVLLARRRRRPVEADGRRSGKFAANSAPGPQPDVDGPAPSCQPVVD
jgi:hypothetical protein